MIGSEATNMQEPETFLSIPSTGAGADEGMAPIGPVPEVARAPAYHAAVKSQNQRVERTIPPLSLDRSVASSLVVATHSFTNCSARSNLIDVAREQFHASTLSSTTPPTSGGHHSESIKRV